MGRHARRSGRDRRHAGGRDAAEQMYEACKIAVESRSAYSMRNCLELRHADLLAETNHQFWKDTVGY